MPRRIQRRRVKGWRMPPGAINCTRPGPFGNPFPVDGSWMVWSAVAIGFRGDGEGRRAAAVELHRAWITGTPIRVAAPAEDGGAIEFSSGETVTMAVQARGMATTAMAMYDPPVLPEIPGLTPLRGHDLVCWCPLEDQRGRRVPCHADVLLELANSTEGAADEGDPRPAGKAVR